MTTAGNNHDFYDDMYNGWSRSERRAVWFRCGRSARGEPLLYDVRVTKADVNSSIKKIYCLWPSLLNFFLRNGFMCWRVRTVLRFFLKSACISVYVEKWLNLNKAHWQMFEFFEVSLNIKLLRITKCWRAGKWSSSVWKVLQLIFQISYETWMAMHIHPWICPEFAIRQYKTRFSFNSVALRIGYVQGSLYKERLYTIGILCLPWQSLFSIVWLLITRLFKYTQCGLIKNRPGLNTGFTGSRCVTQAGSRLV